MLQTVRNPLLAILGTLTVAVSPAESQDRSRTPEPLPSATVRQPEAIPEPQQATLLLVSLAQPSLEAYDDRLGFHQRGLRLDWKDPILRPRFRWQPGETGVRLVEWQLATAPFPDDPTVAPPGLLASGGRSLLAEGASDGQFEIDLTAFRPKSTRQLRSYDAVPFDPGKARPYLYVRVRAIEDSGEFVGRPSNTIKLFFGKPGALQKPKPDTNPPRVRLVRYQSPRAYRFDFQCHGRATRDVVLNGQVVIAKGQKGNLCQSKSKSFLDHIEDALGSVVDLVSSAVDWAAETYNGLKAEAMGVAVGALKSSGIGCGGACQTVVGMALDAGLAAAGMPPSLPDFDQAVAGLQQGGIDALGRTMADAAMSQGVPEPIARQAGQEAAERLVAEAKKTVAATQGGGGSSVWMVDPAGLYSPAVLVVEATNLESGRPTEPAYLKLDSVFSGHAGLFGFTGAKVPPLAPGTSTLVSFELEPIDWEAGWMDLLPKHGDCPSSGLNLGLSCFVEMRNAARAELDRWTDLYVHRQHHFRLATIAEDTTYDEATLVCSGSQPTCAIRFDAPAWRGHRIDVCASWGKDCGPAAAQLFCQRMGYDRALHFERAENIGAETPTRTLLDGKTCADAGCDGFASITCGR